jgi:hypothetical protein
LLLSKQEKKEQRKREKAIRVKILDLQDRHCDQCTLVVSDYRGNNHVYCNSKCKIGIQLKELGDQLVHDTVQKKNGAKVQAPPAPVDKPLEPTKENYLKLKKEKLLEKEIPKFLGLTYPELYELRESWGMVSQKGRSKKAKAPKVEAPKVPKAPKVEIPSIPKDLIPAAPVYPVPDKKVIAKEKYDQLQRKAEWLEKEIIFESGNAQTMEELLRKKERQYNELFKQMQKQDKQLQEKDKLIQDFQKISKEALDAIDHTEQITEQFNLLQDLYMNRVDDKDLIIQNLTSKVCKLEALLIEYLPKGRMEWLLQKTKS